MQNKIEIYQAPNGQIEFTSDSEHETIWATSVLKKYLTEGYAINESKITQIKTILQNLKQTIEFLTTKEIGEKKEIFSLLQNYTKTLSLLENYDKSTIEDFDGKTTNYELTYDETK